MKNKIWICVLLVYFTVLAFPAKKTKTSTSVRRDPNLIRILLIQKRAALSLKMAEKKVAKILRQARIADSLINECVMPPVQGLDTIKKLREYMEVLGFKTGKIMFKKNKFFEIQVTGYKPVCLNLRKRGSENHFTLVAAWKNKKLILVDSYLLKANFEIINPELNGAASVSSLRTLVSSSPMFDQSEVLNDPPDFTGYSLALCFMGGLVDNVLGLGCAGHVNSADSIKTNIEINLRCIQHILDKFEEMIAWLRTECEKGHLTDRAKTKVLRDLSQLKSKAGEGVPYIQNQVNHINDLVQEYKDCMKG